MRFHKRLFFSILIPGILLFLAPRSAHADWKESYLAGENAMKVEHWDDCVKNVQEAVKEKSEENKRLKLYGMRFGYFPHLYLGKCYEKLGLWEEAEAEYKLSVDQSGSDEAKDLLKVAVVEADKVRREKKLMKSWTDLYIFALEAMKNNKWEDAVKHLQNSLKFRQGNDSSFEHLGEKVNYTPHLMLFQCFKALNFKESDMLKELVLSFETEKSDESEKLMAQYLPSVWVNP